MADDIPADATKATILLISAQRSNNIGDHAMLSAARGFVAENFGASVRIETIGHENSDSGDPQADTSILSHGLVYLKHLILKRRRARRNKGLPGISADGVSGPVGWLVRSLLLGQCGVVFVLICLHLWVRLPLPGLIRRVIEKLRYAQAAMTTGGGWMNSNFIITLYEHLFVLLVARRVFGIPIFIVGEQIGPLNNRLDRFMVRQVFRRAELVATRDAHSLAEAGTVLGASDNMSLFCDWAFRLPLQGLQESNGPAAIGINLRRAHYSPISDSQLHALAAALDEVHRRTGCEIHCIPMCFERHESDIAALADLKNLCDCAEAVRLRDDICSIEECQSAIARMQLTLAVSYHCCLFSMMQGLPTIGLVTSEYYRVKLDGLFDLFGVEDGIVDISNVTAQTLADSVVHRMNDLDGRATLASVVDRLFETRRRAGIDLKSRLATHFDAKPVTRTVENPLGTPVVQKD